MEFSVMSLTADLLATSGMDAGGQIVAAMELRSQPAQLLVESTVCTHHPWIHETPCGNT
jgi:hypothetical protein